MDLDQGRDILPPGERPDVQSADDADAADAKLGASDFNPGIGDGAEHFGDGLSGALLSRLNPHSGIFATSELEPMHPRPVIYCSRRPLSNCPAEWPPAATATSSQQIAWCHSRDRRRDNVGAALGSWRDCSSPREDASPRTSQTRTRLGSIALIHSSTVAHSNPRIGSGSFSN